jgi:formyltetrahydrofolate hydrolase
MDYAYSIINSKLDFIEKKTRTLFVGNSSKRKNSPLSTHHSDEDFEPMATFSELNLQSSEADFTHFEQVSRTIHLLEELKYSLRQDNAIQVIALLANDDYLNKSVDELQEVLRPQVEE